MRVIGLDIGSYSIKAAELEVGLRRLEILAFFEEKLPSDPEGGLKPEHIRAAIRDLFSKNHIQPPFKLVASMEGKFISSRFLSLPFTDRVKISQTLPFELEEHIPFALDQIIFDYQMTAVEEQQSKVLVLLSPKDAIKEKLDLFEELEFSPDLLTAGTSALFNLAAVHWEDPGEPYAIMDVGHSETTLCIVEEGSIRHLRTLSMAGKKITEAIQEEYKLSAEEANAAKIENGFVLTDQTNVTKDQKKFSDCIKRALNPLTDNISQTFQSIRSKGHGIVRKVYITGGTSLLRNFAKYLSEELQVEVEPLNTLHPYEMNNVAVTDENNAKCAMALSLGLGYMGKLFKEQINFRKDEFSKSPGGIFGKEVKYLAGMGSLIVAILFLNIIANAVLLKSTHKKIDQKMMSVSKKFPIKVPKHLLNSPAQLRSYLGKKAREHKTKIKALGGGKGELFGVLEVLKEISAMVPKKVLFDVRELTIIDRRVKIKALADSFNAIDSIEKSFKNNTNFTKITKGDISTAADGTNKNFTLSFDIKKKR